MVYTPGPSCLKANLRLSGVKFYVGFFIFCSKAFFGFFFSIVFRPSNCQTVIREIKNKLSLTEFDF